MARHAEVNDEIADETVTSEQQGEQAKGSAPEEQATASSGLPPLKVAENQLAETDEDVTLMWEVSGPRKSRVESIGAFMHRGKVVLAMVYKSGKFKIYEPKPEPAVLQD